MSWSDGVGRTAVHHPGKGCDAWPSCCHDAGGGGGDDDHGQTEEPCGLEVGEVLCRR